MISGYGPNPIFFNKKIKIRRPEHSQSRTSDNFSLLPPTPSQSERHMCITPYDLIEE